MRHQIIWALFLCLLCSCKKRINPEPPEKLFDKYRRSVVLIKNTFYYQIDLSNGLTGYFSELENGEISDLTLDKEEMERNATTAYGSGFFIDETGKIATNRHVVNPQIDDQKALAKLKIKFDEIRNQIQEKQAEIADKLYRINRLLAIYYNSLSYSDYQELQQKKLELETEREELSVFDIAFDFQISKSAIKPVSRFLGVAYENTHVTRESDFQECVVIKSSKDDEIDLAVIQLKDKKTPTGIAYFDFTDHNPNIKDGIVEKGEEYDPLKPLKINEPLYMIGFNYGYALANTQDGLKAQFTQGATSQESDGLRVMYTIPTLQGSSGSPVIDKWGNLIAINYAKVSNTQSFNYGILAKHLKSLLTGEETEDNIDHAESPAKKVNDLTSLRSSSNYPKTKIIKGFLNAEQSRDLDEIFSYFSEDLIQYWDMSYPTREQLKARYIDVWSKLITGKNVVERIEEVDPNTFNLYTRYEFTTKTGDHLVKSKITFVFDDENKIVRMIGQENRIY